MKTTLQYQAINCRAAGDFAAPRRDRKFPQPEHDYQSSALRGNCGSPASFRRERPFFEISQRYFADEAPRSFMVDTGVFAALILTAMLPIAGSVQAVATLIQHLGVL